MPGRAVRTVRLRILGRVQGVGYRYWTERTAAGVGVAGWVRNRRDGTVEGVVSGTPDDVAEMIRRCRDGPSGARVDSIEVSDEAEVPPPGFAVLRTA